MSPLATAGSKTARTLVLHVPWLIRSDGVKTEATNIWTGDEVSLDDVAYANITSDDAKLKLERLSVVHPAFESLAESLKHPAMVPSLSDVLCGEDGWGLLFVELTGRCNESCRHCYANSSPSVETALDWPVIEGIIEDARELGFQAVQFIGGDPLISPHFEEAVRLASDIGTPKIEVFTNGLALNPRLIELLVEHRVDVAFSLYSHSADVHDHVTQTPGSHERTSRAIRNSIDAGLSVRVAGVEGCANGQDEARLREFISELGVEQAHVHIDRQRPVGRGEWTPETELLRVEEEAGAHAGKRVRGRAKLCVTYEGTVVPCIFDRATVLGNVNRQRLTDIMCQEVRAGSSLRTLEVVGEPLACSDCRARRSIVSHLTWAS